jgi:excisionase family DNA binding protein
MRYNTVIWIFAYGIMTYMDMLLTAKQAGERLRVSESTVFRLLKRRQLKGVKLGRALRFTEAELVDFIERHHEQIAPETRPLSPA